MKVNYANKFIKEDRKHLDWSKEVKIIGDNFLRIETPQLLAAFIGYLKFQNIGRIYFRGEKSNHIGIIPSLYRGKEITNEIITNRTCAYNELVDSISGLFKSSRFKRENLNPLLQHYGIKTNWIDLVDNLYIAIWFSLHKNTSMNGYLKIMCELNEKNTLIMSNLREEHSSLSLRPHCQHGISATKKTVKWDLENIDFNDYLVSTIEIPNNNLFELNGEIFTEDYMFPKQKWDNTLKLFLQKKMKDKINEIQEKYNLNNEELGEIE